MYIDVQFHMAVMTMSKARAALPEVLNRVAEGEEITITRHGRAVAVIVRPDIIWSRSRAGEAMSESDQLRDLLAAAANSELPAVGGLADGYAEELVAAIRADRDRR
jgi:antitoxin (DNA-binding transcriptional repressor) of toxin-antitoxin stability system